MQSEDTIENDAISSCFGSERGRIAGTSMLIVAKFYASVVSSSVSTARRSSKKGLTADTIMDMALDLRCSILTVFQPDVIQ